MTGLDPRTIARALRDGLDSVRAHGDRVRIAAALEHLDAEKGGDHAP